MPDTFLPASESSPKPPVARGCGCSPRGCALTLMLLYALQCLVGLSAMWHRYERGNRGRVQLVLYYPAATWIPMFVPGIGALPGLLHWCSGGGEAENIKALDIRLSDGRVYTLYGENFCHLEQLDIRETPEGIQLVEAGGCPCVDTPPIPLSSFQHR